MSDFEAPEGPIAGRTRWKRAGLMLVSAAAAGAVLMALTAQGVIAAQFAISGQPFTVTSSSLQGTGFEQFGVLDQMAGTADTNPNFGTTGGQEVLVTSAIGSATLANLCQSVNFGGVFLKITAGGSSPVHASTLVVDSDSLSGDATFTNIQIDRDPSTFNEVPDGQGGFITGPLGTFGQQADTVQINNLRQNNFSTTAASFTLPGLSLAFVPANADGSGGC